MALASTTAANQSLDGIGGSLPGSPVNALAYTSVHTASTSTTGANEMASTTRQATTWNNASGGTKTNSSGLSFTTPGTNAATHAGTFSAVTAGTFGIGLPLGASVTATTITFAAGALSLASA